MTLDFNLHSASQFDQFLTKKVIVVMEGNKQYIGTLVQYDEYLNVILADAVQKFGDSAEQEEPVGTVLLKGFEIQMMGDFE